MESRERVGINNLSEEDELLVQSLTIELLTSALDLYDQRYAVIEKPQDEGPVDAVDFLKQFRGSHSEVHVKMSRMCRSHSLRVDLKYIKNCDLIDSDVMNSSRKLQLLRRTRSEAALRQVSASDDIEVEYLEHFDPFRGNLDLVSHVDEVLATSANRRPAEQISFQRAMEEISCDMQTKVVPMDEEVCASNSLESCGGVSDSSLQSGRRTVSREMFSTWSPKIISPALDTQSSDRNSLKESVKCIAEENHSKEACRFCNYHACICSRRHSQQSYSDDVSRKHNSNNSETKKSNNGNINSGDGVPHSRASFHYSNSGTHGNLIREGAPNSIIYAQNCRGGVGRCRDRGLNSYDGERNSFHEKSLELNEILRSPSADADMHERISLKTETSDRLNDIG